MGMPAATVTSMHVCPKTNPGPVPHVGGARCRWFAQCTD